MGQYITVVNDMAASVNFGGKAHSDTLAVVNFTNQLHTADFHADVNFFLSNHQDQKAYVNFALGGNHTDLPAIVHFYEHSENFDLLSNVSFPYAVDNEATVTFTQLDEEYLESKVTFKIPHDTLSNVTFFQNNKIDLLSYVFLGSFKKDLLSTITFIQNGFSDFQTSIIINNTNVQEISKNYSDTFDTQAFLRIPGIELFDLPADVTFGQSHSFVVICSLNIRNRYLGVGNSTVNAISADDSETSHNIFSKDFNSNSTITDGTGYFSINNLLPGTYIIAPVINGVQSTPSSYTVTITNANIYLYFGINQSQINSVPILASGTATQQDNPVCYINNDLVNPGTYSIEGFIKFYDGNYTDLLTIITDDNLIDGYLGLLNNYGL